MFLTYGVSIWGLWFIGLTVLLQGVIAAVAHRRQSQYVPGKVDEELSHDSFVFRSHRTFQNSLENLTVFILPALLAIFVGTSPTLLAAVVWTFAIARVMHMVLYYAIATEKNPSPRSYFYILGLLATIALYIVVLLGLVA